MKTFQIFEHVVPIGLNANKTKTFAVWVTDGHLQFVIDGEIQHDIENIVDFLREAAEVINKGDDDSTSNLEVKARALSDDTLENYENGSVGFDKTGTSPGISLQDSGTEVKISGQGSSGASTFDFGTDSGNSTNASQEAAIFKAFAEDLLGAAELSSTVSLTKGILENTSSTDKGNVGITVSEREDDIKLVQFKHNKKASDSWADKFIDDLGEMYGGTQVQNGNVSEKGYKAGQLNMPETMTVQGVTYDHAVKLGAQGVGGSESWAFADAESQQAFYDDVKYYFGGGADRRDIINATLEALAEDLGGVQLKNGKVSSNYEARQIKLAGENDDIVDLGSQGVGGKETYQFGSTAMALEFIDAVRNMVGVEAQARKVVDKFIFDVKGPKVTNETIAGKDAFVEYVGDFYGGDLMRDGSVSESFDGSVRLGVDGDDFTATLGPRGVGGKEIWAFGTEEDRDAFVAALDEFMI